MRKEVRRARVAGHVAELVQDQQIRHGVLAQAPLDRGERLMPPVPELPAGAQDAPRAAQAIHEVVQRVV